MWRTRQTRRSARIIVTIAVAVLALAVAAACTSTEGKTGSDQKLMDAIAKQIQTTLSQRPDVVNAEVSYQNTVDASERADVNVKVKAGTDFAPVIDDATRLVWQSKLNPLSSINIGVIDAGNLQRGDTRRINLLDKSQKADLEGKYGTRPK